MKSIITYPTIISLFLLLSMKSDNNKKNLLCHKWVQFASKKNMASKPQLIDKSMATVITFKTDGTYEDAIYNNQFRTSGNWYLNNDSTKMEFMLLNLNGKDVPPFPETTRHYNIIILKLTRDTLIYGNEFYIGNDPKNWVYDHSDSYFVRND